MKAFAKFTLLAILLSSVFGCATSGRDSRIKLTPPDAINAVYMGYEKLPGQKVFVIAVDPSGEWAYGYDDSQATLEEAAKNAAVKCDAARKKFNVFAPARIFAINNDVIYYNIQK